MDPDPQYCDILTEITQTEDSQEEMFKIVNNGSKVPCQQIISKIVKDHSTGVPSANRLALPKLEIH
jgi:hypothetical protein